jgi:hypothetical protein
MDVCISLRSADLDLEKLQVLTEDLCRDLNRESDAQARLDRASAMPGTKGDPVTIGTIAITFLTSGVAVSLVKVLETYLGRKRSLEMELSRPDGKKFVIRALDVGPVEIARTQELVKDFFGGA